MSSTATTNGDDGKRARIPSIVTIDSNLLGFAEKTASLITGIDIGDVVDGHSLYSSIVKDSGVACRRDDGAGGKVSDARRQRSPPLPKQQRRHSTIRTRWCGSRLLSDDVCIPVPTICRHVHENYQKADLVLYDTPASAEAATRLAVCLQRRIVATFVYVDFEKPDAKESVDGVFDRSTTLDAPSVESVVVVVVRNAGPDSYAKSDHVRWRRRFLFARRSSVAKRSALLIRIENNRCRPGRMARYVAYVVRSFQKYGKLIDRRPEIVGVRIDDDDNGGGGGAFSVFDIRRGRGAVRNRQR